VRVVCLEQGDWHRSFAVRVCPDDVRGSASARRHSLFPTVRQRPEDYPIVTAGAGPTDMVMWNGVGRSTVHWEGHFPRMHPSDFRVDRLDGVADDWPIGFSNLEAFYNLNDRNIGVSGTTGDPANPRRSARQTRARRSTPHLRSVQWR
jgi:choline dehydrogenase-like flavoprotein